MNITKDVINDLLPVYLAGEASGDTRDLIEDYLRRDPEMAAAVRAEAAKNVALLHAIAPVPADDHEKATFERIRQHNRYRTQFFVFAMIFALFPFSTSFADGHVTWIMLRDSPKQAGMFWIISGLCWIARGVLTRQRSAM